MKKNVIALFASLIFFAAFAQNKPTVTWFGVDFTKAKMIGKKGFREPKTIQSYYLRKWNEEILRQDGKFNLKIYAKKGKVLTNLDVVNAQNDKVDADQLVISEKYSITEGDVQSVVSNYVGKGSGNGIVMVVESFNKKKKKAYIYPVLFDIASGNIIKMKKQKGKAGGMGFRNYWIGAIFHVMRKGIKK